MRNTKTEFVSCPSCGRTLFDLQEVTAQISARTGHLPGAHEQRTAGALGVALPSPHSQLLPLHEQRTRPPPYYLSLFFASRHCPAFKLTTTLAFSRVAFPFSLVASWMLPVAINLPVVVLLKFVANLVPQALAHAAHCLGCNAIAA
eukprot:6201318-Pleurochrysis_carterae.AAC.2